MSKGFRDGRKALEGMLERAERAPASTRVIAYPDYRGMESEEERAAFHRIVDDAEARGAIRAERRRWLAPADIAFLRLIDAGKLAHCLGLTPASIVAEVDIGRLREAVCPLPDWVDALIGEIGDAWRVRRESYGLTPGDVSAASKFLMILSAIHHEVHRRTSDMRHFSSLACKDSKAVEDGAARLARVLRIRFDIPATEPKEVLAALGIEKVPQPVLIRAPLQLGEVRIALKPYIGLPPEWASTFDISAVPPYVLVIENLASFNRHCREVGDDGIVVFSGGFPSRAVMTAIRRLDTLLAETVPFFHWGDGDRSGHLISAYIAEKLHRTPRQHLMDTAALEQEETDPQSPLS